MRPLAAGLCLLALAQTSCGEDPPLGPERTKTPSHRCATAPTWEGFAQGMLTTWCTPCHASSLEGTERQGAPAEVDLDTLDDALRWADRIQARTVDSATMPPGGGPTEEERARLGEWLACGLGTTEPPAPCSEATKLDGDVRIDTDQGAHDLCADGPLHLRGGLEVVDTLGALGCVCAVDGPVQVDGGTLQLPAATHLGSLSATGAVTLVSAPLLATLDGPLSLHDAPSLRLVDLTRLASVKGAVTVSSTPVLEGLELGRLTTVDGPLVVHDAGLRALEIPRLASAPSVAWSELPRLQAPPLADTLQDVPGGLVIEGVDVDDLSQGLDSLVDTTGSLTLRSLPTVGLQALRPLNRVRGDLVIEDLPELVDASGLDNLEQVRGDLVIRDVPGVPLAEWEAWSDGIEVEGTLVLEP